jgi:peptidoglycan/xylan/chitin deacetylase (PgdA/CDA1 family)
MVNGDGTAALVLCYHAVSDEWPCELAVTPAALERQLGLLLRRGYWPVTFSQALATTRPRTLAVTFDDGYRSVLGHAYRVLARLGIPGSVFVPTDCPGRDDPMSWPGIEQWSGGAFADELRSLSWDELRWLAGRGWEIGSHTRSHACLTRLKPTALAVELAGSRGALEAELRRPCCSLAYPYGATNAAVVAAAGRAGYRWGAALGARPVAAGPLACPRVGVYRGDGGWRFRAKLSRPLRHVVEALRDGTG